MWTGILIYWAGVVSGVVIVFGALAMAQVVVADNEKKRKGRRDE